MSGWPIRRGKETLAKTRSRSFWKRPTELHDLKDIKWHFIGHLQSNKVNMLLKCPNLVSIHSIDSIKLLNKLLSKQLDIDSLGLFLQVNTSDEKEKADLKIHKY